LRCSRVDRDARPFDSPGEKARYLLPMLPMVAIIAAYPFQGVPGRVFAAARLDQGFWLLMPALLIGGLLVASDGLPNNCRPCYGVMILGALQVLQWRCLPNRTGARKPWPFVGLALWRCTS
jgi:hypothetical protein